MTENNDLLMNGANGAAPSYMAGVGEDQAFGEGMDGNAFPRLAFKGSRFRLRQGDEEIVMKETSIEVIILKDFPAISRVYFAGAYDPDGDGKPACASADGEFPLSTIAAPQGKNCATCTQNEKGSVITDDGRKTRACSFFKRLVILIKGYEEVGPIVTDIKAMSLFGDSQSGENLWSLKAYFARLKSNGVQPFHIVTEITFNTDESVPVVLFRPLGYVDETMFTNEVTPLIGTPDGTLKLEEMVDTSKVNIAGEEGGSSGNTGFRDKLLEGDKPAHLSGPAPDLQGQLDAAIADSDFALAGKIKAQMDALADKPVVKKAKPKPAKVDVQGIVDGFKVDMKKAVEANDYALAAEIQEKMVNFINEQKAAKTEPAGEQTQELSPQQKAARTRARNKAKKEAAAKAAAEAEAAGEPAVPAGEEDGEGFGDELEGALKDFGF